MNYTSQNFLSFDINYDTLNLLSETIDRYSMVSRKNRVLVAFSGGKDSLFVVIALRALGYEVTPISVDMGYETDWAKRIAYLAERYGFYAEVVDVRGTAFKNRLSQQDINVLDDRLRILDSINPREQNNLTPCTQCYSIKIIALASFARKEGYKTVVLGHHGTDAIASMLKSAFMFIDRWDYGHEVFNRDNYEQLIENSKSSFLDGLQNLIKSQLYKRIGKLVEQQVVATDEPPIQELANSLGNLRIIRPMFYVPEYTIKEHRDRSFVHTEGSGCGHGATKDTETPREIVHQRILDNIEDFKDGPMIYKELLQLCENGIKQDGALKFEVRRERERILGPAYKPDFGCYIRS